LFIAGIILFLALFGGYLIDIMRLNLANIRTLQNRSIQPVPALTAWGGCRQAQVNGRNLLLQGRYDQSLHLLQEAAGCANDHWAWFYLGQAQYVLGDLTAAAQSWRQTPEGYNQAARLAQNAATQAAGDEEAAMEAWRFAAQVGPAEQTPYIQMARLVVESNPAQHQALLQEAIAADPNNPAAYIELGSYYRQAGNPAEAQPYLVQAHELDPANISLLVTLAENTAELGDIPGAINYWQEVALRNERRRALAYGRIGSLALNDANYTSALAFFLRAAEIEPENPEHTLGLARAYFELGCKAEATNAYQHVLETSLPEAAVLEAQEKLAELAVMPPPVAPCPNGQ
jgi:tetratricopeptide (TPR) repeat protein